MPRFEAQIWVSGELPYQVETNAANIFAAKEIIARREGVEEHEVQRVFQINEESSSSSNSDSGGGDISFGGIIALAAFIFGAWLLVTFWPLFIVGGLIWFVWWIFD